MVRFEVVFFNTGLRFASRKWGTWKVDRLRYEPATLGSDYVPHPVVQWPMHGRGTLVPLA